MTALIQSKKAIIRSLGVLSALCAFTLVTGKARSEVLLGVTYTEPIIFGGASYLVDFNGKGTPGGETFTFSTTQPNTRVVITFNAECAVEGEAWKWVDLDIIVDPAGSTGETVVPPSNSDNAFCSGNGTTSSNFGLDGWVSATTQATMVLPEAGTHTVKVRVNGGSAGVTRLDDLSLVIQR
jgi:hypothetical protein